MKSASFLPKAFRWVFTVLVVLFGLAAFGVIVAIIADPHLPANAQFGPVSGEVLGQPAEIAIHTPAAGGEPVVDAKAFNGVLTVRVEKAAGMVELLKSYGLPLVLIKILFLTALFELLRRLFRNVGRGDTFTPQSVRLVQIVGFLLIGFSVLYGLAGSWFVWAAWDYFSQHTQIAVSGTPVQLPPAGPHGWFGEIQIFDWVFFSGLLVLALAEVFRQGLALKRDSDLTV